jgi:hypothetical protein
MTEVMTEVMTEATTQATTEATCALSVSIQYTPELGHRLTIRLSQNDLSSGTLQADLREGTTPFRLLEPRIIRHCRDRYGAALSAAYQHANHWYGIGSVTLDANEIATLTYPDAA